MKQLISCEFNIDTACVELKYSDGSMIAINCAAVEDEVANSCFQRSELDWLIYNDPLSYISSSLVLKIRCVVSTVRMIASAGAVSFGIHREAVNP